MPVYVRIDEAALGRFLNDRTGPLARDLLRRGFRVAAVAKQLAPVRSGRLRGSIRPELVFGAPGVFGAVGPVCFVGSNVDYAIYQEEGTGVYGPRHAPIVPVNARILSWVDRRTGERAFARSVRGAPGRHYLLSALESERGRR